ncbi:putative beta-glucosidase, partial [Aureobasidium pullulans]
MVSTKESVISFVLFTSFVVSIHGATISSSALATNPTKPSTAQITSVVNAAVKNTTQSSSLSWFGDVVSSQTALVPLVLGAWQALQIWQAWLLKTINPELFYSYGGSPPVYPTPQGSGAGFWTWSYLQAKVLVAQMTVPEKNTIVYGSSSTEGCSGFSGSVPRLGFPGLCLNDAESGVRNTTYTNGYPAQLHLGASWNRSLAYDRGYYIGREFKAKGVNVALGPVIGPMGRVAKGGRNWEGFSNDPYLAAGLVVPTINGMQQSVVACAKHFITNEQETNRNPFLSGLLSSLINLNNSVSSNLDDRTMHELYLWPCYATQNSKILNGLLKTELGFEGFVVSDWDAQHTGIASANAGLDLAMPSSSYWDSNQLSAAVFNGSVQSTRLNDMVVRIVAAWYRYAHFTSTGLDGTQSIDARELASQPTLLEGAVEGHVLVKNSNNALPLGRPSDLNLFGYDAIGGSNATSSSYLHALGLINTQAYTNGTAFTETELVSFFAAVEPANAYGPDIALNGTLFTGGGSGATTPSSSTSPFDAFSRKAAMDNTTLHYDFVSQNPLVQAPNSPCIVFINAQSSESWDRNTLADDYSDDLVTHVASSCSNTIVVLHNAGIRVVDNWIDNANISAVIFAHLPGQESGNALVDIMYGRVSPSGRLPYTVAKSQGDYGSLLNPTLPDQVNPQYSQSDFVEGLYIDYKHFIRQGITPRFAFGYGLTYTNFTYSSMQVSRNWFANTAKIPYDAVSPTTAAPEGGLTSLYDVIANVTVDVTNTGNFTAAEVAQLYVNVPKSGLPKALRGFDKITIAPGKKATYSFPLRRRDLSIWDNAKQQWILQSGVFTLMVGKS